MINSYGQDIDAMWEASTARLWEDLNDIPEEEEQEQPWESGWYPAISELQEAMRKLNEAAAKLHDAAGKVAGCPEEHRIESLAMETEDQAAYIENQISRMERQAG